MRNVCLSSVMVNNSIDIIIQKIVRDSLKLTDDLHFEKRCCTVYIILIIYIIK
jgi:hypothetical protein